MLELIEEHFKSKYANKFNSIKRKLKEDGIFIAIVIIVIIMIVLVKVLVPEYEKITITGFEWDRSISVEEYQTIKESGWELPEGAKLISNKEEFYGFDEKVDHYETVVEEVTKQKIVDYEDGVSAYKRHGKRRFERIIKQRPVYEEYTETEEVEKPVYQRKPVFKTKYYYTIAKWVYTRSLTTNGRNKNTHWGDTSLLAENERVFNTCENYYILGINKKGDKVEIVVSEKTWKEFEEGDTVKLKTSYSRGGDQN